MEKNIIELIVGNFEEKRAYRQMMKRVNALPKNYRYVYKKNLKYGYNFGFCFLQTDLLDYFEECAANGLSIQEAVGQDAAGFCDELMCISGAQSIKKREQFNQEILNHFFPKGE